MVGPSPIEPPPTALSFSAIFLTVSFAGKYTKHEWHGKDGNDYFGMPMIVPAYFFSVMPSAAAFSAFARTKFSKRSRESGWLLPSSDAPSAWTATA